jgi:hypothetical protein
VSDDLVARAAVTIQDEGTIVTLEQDDCPSERAREEYGRNWAAVLASLEKVVESR